jgi:phage shock protein A
MFWALIVLLGCLVYMRGNQRVIERQAKMEAESARRQEQTYQAMVQHYRQVAMEQQTRMDSHGPRSNGGSGAEVAQLLAENTMQRMSRLEARLEGITKELEQCRREVEGCEGTATTLFTSVSDMHHKMNNISNAVQMLLEKD